MWQFNLGNSHVKLNFSLIASITSDTVFFAALIGVSMADLMPFHTVVTVDFTLLNTLLTVPFTALTAVDTVLFAVLMAVSMADLIPFHIDDAVVFTVVILLSPLS